ncbi:MAG: hypothetical protein ACI9O1_000496 [Candidatus Thalassarchaeaceae archaeon]|jgi:hypothetical protein
MSQFYEMQYMVEPKIDFNKKLQHPRRSLGNRHRSQAVKFLKLENNRTNLEWAEQNAKQSILYDFTNPENWKILIKIKVINRDNIGIKIILEDLFNVLGRDNESLSQLNNLNLVEVGENLLNAAFKIDPLDLDKWWENISNNEEEIEKFCDRLKKIDTRDPRSNILFSRRLEKFKKSGYEEIFLDLSKYLLAQKPENYEVWIELGKIHERREEYDEAWFSYDQAQYHFPQCQSKNNFKKRMESKLEDSDKVSWIKPKLSDRVQFLKRMEKLANVELNELEINNQHDTKTDNEYDNIERLIEENKIQEAFFKARSMAAEGDEIAEILVKKILRELNK